MVAEVIARSFPEKNIHSAYYKLYILSPEKAIAVST